MKTTTKLLAGLLPALLLASVSADELTIEGDLNVEGDVEIDETLTVHGDDGVVFFGDGIVNNPSDPTDHWGLISGGSGSIPIEGPGTRFMWYPAKAAFRGGWVAGSSWDDSHISPGSFAFGLNPRASGHGSVAMGLGTVASGSASMAVGDWTTASGEHSVAMGEHSTASGHRSFAIGTDTGASSSGSMALGSSAYAIGQNSTAIGSSTYAFGIISTAMGDQTDASGRASTAMGFRTKADSLSSMAIGQYNLGGGHATQWNGEDPLFEIGNGTSFGNRSNAVTVYKNGNMEVSGTIRTAEPAGDLSMGAFTAQP